MRTKHTGGQVDISRIRQVYSRNITELIKELRYRNRLTQSEFSDLVGINRALICQYESGEREPSFESIIKIAQYAKVSVDYLLGIQPSNKFDLTEGEEDIIGVWRKLPAGAEMNVKKEADETRAARNYQVVVKQELKI